ncbi:MAG TPA: cation:proton antiporter [Salinimicrobium sp.]|nr:cation:proton antiporter [Salinimicrobium sp.]
MTINEYIEFIILPILGVSIVLVGFRFLMGPTIADRIIALDLLITIGSGIICIYSLFANEPVLLDVAMILALIAFLSTVAFSYYLKKRKKK